jgi:hypothetical protein
MSQHESFQLRPQLAQSVKDGLYGTTAHFFFSFTCLDVLTDLEIVLEQTRE